MIFQHSIVCLYGSPSKRRFNKHLLQEKNDERNSIPSRIYNVGGGGGGGGGEMVVLGLGFVVERSVFTQFTFFFSLTYKTIPPGFRGVAWVCPLS